MLKAVAPRTPEDTLSETLLETRDIGQVVFHSATEDDLASCILLVPNSRLESVVPGLLELSHLLIYERCHVVKRNLLAGGLPKLGGYDI